MKHWLALAALVVMSGCPEAASDSGETQSTLPPLDGPTVEFDPANAIIPFPNNLVINPATGKVTIPAPACETPAAKAVREGVLNTLDGFGTYEAAMQVTFTDDVDPNTLNGNVVMYQRTKMGNPVTPSPAAMVPVQVSLSTALRFNAADCAAAPAQIHAVTIVPMVPLDQKSTYTVALLDGIKTTSGKPYIPSFTWALVRQSTDPVQLADGCDYANPTSCTVVSEQTPLNPAGDANNNGVPDIIEIVGLDQLWKAHATGLAFLDANGHDDRSKILLAWEVTTQTVTDPLDPMFPDSPASSLSTAPLLGVQSLVCDSADASCPNGYPHGQGPFAECSGADSSAECFLKIALGSSACGAGCTAQQIYQAGTAVCGQVGCAAVGDVLAGGLGETSYQVLQPNPGIPGGAKVPGAWSDPVHPMQQAQAGGTLQFIAFVPAQAAPATGYPTTIFGHGLGRSKNDLFAIGPQLAANGYASIAIDFVASGSRAVQISNDAALGCNGTPNVVAAPQCFSPILSTDLAQTRDNIRQTVLDLQRLTNALITCGANGCASGNSTATLAVDSSKIEYVGQSLGGIIGSVFVAVEPHVKAAVLNVAAVGLLDVLEHTDNLTIRCSLVNGLIDAGILIGDKWNPQAGTGLCTTDAWKMQPSYVQFSGIARIVLDPADPANYTAKLATRRFLLQEVVGDAVVPNYATNFEGALTGLTPADADLYLPTVNTNPSAALTAMPLENHWLQYKPIAASATTGPGNTFAHGSLLAPANSGQDGQLGTARMQTDAIFFLKANQ